MIQMDNAIIVSNLVKYIAGVKILENISFNVSLGEKVLITGPSMSGKTTIVRCMLDIYSRDSGYIEVLGKDPLINREEVLESIGYVPQKTKLPSELYPYDILKLECTLLDRKIETCIEELRRILPHVNIDRLLNTKGKYLEPYSRKAYYVGLALLKKPTILIIDEPLENMDRKTIEILQENIEEENTLLVLSRGYGLDIKYDKVIRMERGRITSIKEES